MEIGYTEFISRQFDASFRGTNLSGVDKEALIFNINNNCHKLIDGYAPFCKLLFIHNNTEVKTGTVPITMMNERFLQTDYIKRRDGEKAVLTRFLNIPNNLKHEIPVAKFLMVILYSREQINLESDESGESLELGYTPFEYDWGIVSINAQMVDFEEPMNPITMMRNALGMGDGGSGISIDDEAYQKSVEFWSKNAIIS